ncbi:hypothetical protein GW17_00054773 [Ensete ventricosum]|nr:hypothetical protein GW17_00054773 [Ensete ventricosum]RZS08273.1 hypothetical protein BHM03_00039212 [Ensete ventricosum]
MRRDLPPWHRGSRCNLHAPTAPLHVITNNHKHAVPTINEKNVGSPPSPSLRHRRCYPYVGGDCPLRSAAALPRGGHPYDRRRRPYWRQGWPLAVAPAGWPCPRVAAFASCCPCGRSPLAGGLAVAATPTGGLAMASHLCMHTSCMWPPLPYRQRLFSLPIAAISA